MASKLNHYAIGKILGGKMRLVKGARFGNFSLLETTAEVLRPRTPSAGAVHVPRFSYAKKLSENSRNPRVFKG